MLGEPWSSILSGCLMEQAASVDNVKGCEGGGQRISVSDWGNWNNVQGLLPQTFHREDKLKRERKNPGKQFMFVTWFSLAGPACPYQSLAVFTQFFPIVFHLSSKACHGCSEPFFPPKSLWRG